MGHPSFYPLPSGEKNKKESSLPLKERDRGDGNLISAFTVIFWCIVLFLGETSFAETKLRRTAMENDVRKSIIAGSWYPGRPELLRSQIQGFLKTVPEASRAAGELKALIVPHAGYTYSGGVAAYAYKQLTAGSFSQVIIIAPSHRYPFRGASIDQKTGYETPLGIVPVDRSLARAIAEKSSIFKFVPAGHDQEHSLEIQLPFLQERLQNLENSGRISCHRYQGVGFYH